MKINFDSMAENENPNFLGGEKSFFSKMFIDDHGKIFQGRLEPGASIGVHTHGSTGEIILALSGCADAEYDGKTEHIEKGECHYCPNGHSHGLKNNGTEDFLFFAVVPEYKGSK